MTKPAANSRRTTRSGAAAGKAAERVIARSLPLSGYPMHRLTVDQYHRLVESGILHEDERVELLDGWLVEKMPQNPPHSGTVHHVTLRLSKVLGDDWVIRERSPITTSTSEPEPDIAVVKPPPEQYFGRHPGSRQIGLLIEVSDSTVEQDRLKSAIYAAASVPAYWLINLPERQIEVSSGPMPRKGQYRQRVVYSENDRIPVVLGGSELTVFRVKDLLPPLS